MRHAFSDGIRRVAMAPALVAGVYIVTLLTAVPLGVVVHGAISRHLGRSAAAERVARGVDWPWWEEFLSQATGVAGTFQPHIMGFAAVLSNQSNLVDGTRLPLGVLFAVGAYLAVWTFLIGGVIDRLARQRRVGSVGFFAACGTHVFRFVRLGVLAGGAYWILFGPVHGWLFDDLYEAATRNLTVERSDFLIRSALYAIFGLLLLPVNLVFDYAKVRTVVEDRRSMVGAVLAALRFIRRRPRPTIGLYLLNGGLFLAVVAAYAILAPGASSGAPSTWLVFVVGQAYIGARLFTKLVFYASQTSYFQSQLAHAGYVATPRRVWPDSPAAEAIGGTTA